MFHLCPPEDNTHNQHHHSHCNVQRMGVEERSNHPGPTNGRTAATVSRQEKLNHAASRYSLAPSISLICITGMAWRVDEFLVTDCPAIRPVAVNHNGLE